MREKKSEATGGTGISRRGLLAGAGGALAATSVGPFIHIARAQKRVVRAGFWTGVLAKMVRERVAPWVEEKTGAQVIIEEGITLDQLAKMRAERSNPQHTVMGIDDIAVSAAKKEGLIERLDPGEIPGMKEIYPEFILEDNHGAGMALNWSTVYYHTQKMAEPKSYREFWNAAYKGRIITPSIKPTQGFFFLIVASHLKTGKPIREAQYDVGPGFEMWKALKPNLHSMYDSLNSAMPLLAQGEAWLTFGSSRVAGSWLIRGAPVARALVKEGTFMGLNCVSLVKGGPHPDVGKKIIERLLSPEVQAEFSAKATTGPTNRTVKLAPDVAKWVPYGPEDLKEMHTAFDWNYINTKRAEWTDRWNKEVAT